MQYDVKCDRRNAIVMLVAQVIVFKQWDKISKHKRICYNFSNFINKDNRIQQYIFEVHNCPRHTNVVTITVPVNNTSHQLRCQDNNSQLHTNYCPATHTESHRCV